MANILERLGDIISSNVHAALDKCEDPEKMLDQNMRKAMEELAELKDAAAKLKADQRSAQRNYEAALKKMQAEHSYAVNAMRAGDEGTAAKFLQSEARIKTSEVDSAKALLDAANNNYEKVRTAYNKLADDVEFMKNQMNTIKGTMKAAKTTEKIAAMKDKNSGYSASFTNYAEKAQRMLDEANAKIDMDTEQGDGLESLREKYAGGMQANLSESLAALKSECGIVDERGVYGVGNDESDTARKAVEAMSIAMDDLRREAGTK